MGGDVFEIRNAIIVFRNTSAIVLDTQISLAFFTAADNIDFRSAGVDAVFDKLGNRL